MTPKELKQRCEAAFITRDRFKTLFQDAYDYTMPTRQGFDQSSELGSSRTDRIFDETAVVGVNEFAAELQSSLLPPFSRWAEIKAGSEIPEEAREEIDAELQKVTETVFDYIANSNFDQEINEALLDLSVGTGILKVEEGDNIDPLRFQAVPLTEIALEDGPDGLVDDVHYRRFVKPEHLKVMFPKMSREALETVKNRAQGDSRIELLQSTVRNRSTPNVRKWDYIAHLPGQEMVLSEAKYDGRGSNPWIIFRWSKAAGECYGRGPVISALPAIRTCNLVVQLVLENADMAITGMYQADDDGVINPDSIVLSPGLIVPRAPGSRIEALQNPSNFDVSQLILDDMRHNIRKALFNQQLGRPHEATPMSATEVAERMAQLAQEIGPAFGRLMKELVEPVIQRVIFILKKRGLIQLPTLDGRELKLVSRSPLAAAQRMQDVTNMDRFMQRIGAIFGPQITQVIVDQNRTSRWYAEKQQIPLDLLRDESAQAEMMKAAVGQLDPAAAEQPPDGGL
jgi:hypothetical protein